MKKLSLGLPSIDRRWLMVELCSISLIGYGVWLRWGTWLSCIILGCVFFALALIRGWRKANKPVENEVDLL